MGKAFWPAHHPRGEPIQRAFLLTKKMDTYRFHLNKGITIDIDYTEEKMKEIVENTMLKPNGVIWYEGKNDKSRVIISAQHILFIERLKKENI